jgi:hypothetical protein
MFSNSIGETSSFFFLSGETFRLIEACDEKKLRDIDKSLRYRYSIPETYLSMESVSV